MLIVASGVRCDCICRDRRGQMMYFYCSKIKMELLLKAREGQECKHFVFPKETYNNNNLKLKVYLILDLEHIVAVVQLKGIGCSLFTRNFFTSHTR